MANWFDVVSLVIFSLLFSGAIYAAMTLSKQFAGAVATTKDGLKKRGLDISANGVSVKTDKRLDREDYLAATGRNLVDVMKASSYGSRDNQKAALGKVWGGAHS